MSKSIKKFVSDYEESRLEALANYQILDTPQDVAFDNIAELASIICDAPIAVINFIDRDRQWFKSVKGLPVRETPLDLSICVHTLLQPGVFIIPDASLDDRLSNNPLVTGEPYLRFYAGALLESQEGYPLGTLCVLDYKPRELTECQHFALQVLANQVKAHMELMRSHQEQEQLILELNEARNEMAHLATTDMLTGLLNRRAFQQRMEEAIALLRRGADSMTLMMVDVDHFKRINDSLGHPVGDEVLKRFAKLCQSVLRQADVLARWGGEEFLFLMPATSVKEANRAAERLLALLVSTPVALSGSSTPVFITASIGICSLTAASDVEGSLRAVDGLLYQAKQQGRNCIALENCF